MSGAELATTQTGGNNASEFVRKLYRMLEDPTHQDVARWGKDGDTFVVEDGERFTRSILPKHFKHSNMSSFIRQLNKYDFHKVKPSSDSETMGNVLEFKHPYFRVDSKDDLDNIRRKAPAPRKAPATEDYSTQHHMSVISEQLTAQAQQVQHLQELYAEVSQTNKVLVNEVLTLNKMLHAQRQAQYEMLNHLTPFNGNNDGRSNNMMGQSLNGPSSAVSESDDPPELRRARELLSSVSTDSIVDRELERLHGVYASPSDSSALMPPSIPMMHDPMNDLNRYPVYPVGQTVGIDPFHSDHIHKIPYSLPQEGGSALLSEAPVSQPLVNPTTPTTAGQMGKPDSMWGAKKPNVFLVEDDPTCAKIGIKFLKSMGCEVEHASNGADAVSRVSNVGRDHFDMIFMDIIMPRLDGVSATLYIRGTHPAVPIIAMTSNIRPEEVNGYFDHGMNGVLAKPFTKEGMWKSVKTHASHLLKNPPQNESHSYMLGGGAFFNTQMGPGNNSIKFDTPTPPSGTGASTWSPAGMQQPSPVNNGNDQGFSGMMNGANQYAMAGNRYTSIQNDSSRISDHDSPPEKRQRLNAGPGNY